MAKALILIDIQKGFDDHAHWGAPRNNPGMENHALALLDHWRKHSWPVIHIRHDSTDANSPLRPGQSGNEFKPGFEPGSGETVIGKEVNSAFIGTDLSAQLIRLATKEIVICGISTEHCVSTTTRMAGNLGYEVTLAADACHAWSYGELDAELIHKTQLAVLDGEFARVKNTKSIIADISAGD